MPIYSYICPECRVEAEEYRPMSERHNGPACHLCGRKMELTLKGFRTVAPSSYPYYDPVLEREITGPGHKREVLRELGLEQRS